MIASQVVGKETGVEVCWKDGGEAIAIFVLDQGYDQIEN